jgi:hypothetical protein
VELSACCPILALRTAVPRRTSANYTICWKRGAMPESARANSQIQPTPTGLHPRKSRHCLHGFPSGSPL